MVKDLEPKAKNAKGSVIIRCDICLVQVRPARVQQCHVCGKNLCADHYLAGLCPDHFHALDETKQPQLLQQFSFWKLMARRVSFGIIPVSFLAIVLVVLIGVYIATFNVEQWIPIGNTFLVLGPPFFVLVWLCLRWSKKAAISKAQILAFIGIVERLQNVGTSAEEKDEMKKEEEPTSDNSDSQQISHESDGSE